jgi:hypothetical protein
MIGQGVPAALMVRYWLLDNLKLSFSVIQLNCCGVSVMVGLERFLFGEEAGECQKRKIIEEIFKRKN